jgi:hypothetical protein
MFYDRHSSQGRTKFRANREVIRPFLSTLSIIAVNCIVSITWFMFPDHSSKLRCAVLLWDKLFKVHRETLRCHPRCQRMSMLVSLIVL